MDAAERARIDRVKRAVLEGRTMPMFAKPPLPVGWVSYALVYLLPAVLCVLGYLIVVKFAPSLYISIPVTIGLNILIWAGPAAITRMQRRVKRSVDELLAPHQGFVCPRCHYPLTGCPDEDQCPECGTLYTRVEVIDLWTRTYNLKHNWPKS